MRAMAYRFLVLWILCISPLSLVLDLEAQTPPSFANGLIAYYRFEEGRGIRVGDSSGHALNAAIFGLPVWTPGKIGKALKFNGSTDYASLAHNLALDVGSGSWSISLWAKLGTQSADHRYLIYKGTGTDGWGVRVMTWGASKRFVADFFDGGAKNSIGMTAIDDAKWHHLAAVLDRNDGGKIKLFVDGVEEAYQAQSSVGGAVNSNSGDLYIGSSATGAAYSGALDSLRIYNRALSKAETQSIYAAELEDSRPPEIAISAPAPGAPLSGTITLSANATDSSGVSGVRFMLDNGSNIGPEDTSAPYQLSWDSAYASNGAHTITAIARDALGNSAVSAPVSVTISNAMPRTYPSAVSSYNELRTIYGKAGMSISLTSASLPGINGVFTYASENPFALEDSGIAIRAANGWWIRSFNHSPTQPIELDWFQLTDGSNITTLLLQLAENYRPLFFVRMPSVARTFTVDYLDFKALGMSEVGLLESNAKITWKLGSAGGWFEGPTGKGHSMMKFGGIKSLVIGSATSKPNRDDYNFSLVGDFTFDDHMWYDDDKEIWNRSDALLRIDLPGGKGGGVVHLRANTKDAWGEGLAVDGSSKLDQLFVSGVHANSSVKVLNGTVREVKLENPYFSDPFATCAGWDGRADGLTDWTSDDGDPPRFSYGRTPGFFLVEKLSGQVDLQYGAEGIAFFLAKRVGNGPNEPLVVQYRDIFYTETGVEIVTQSMNAVSKYDGIGSPDQPNVRHVKYVEGQSRYGLGKGFRYTLYLEASPNWTPPSMVATANIDFTMVNVSRIVRSGVHPEKGYGSTHHLTFRGDGIHPAMLTKSDPFGMIPVWGLQLAADDSVIRDGQFGSILVQKTDTNIYGRNLLENITVTGSVEIGWYFGGRWVVDGIKATRLNKVTWLGPAREIMRIAPNSDVTANDIWAPIGSTIVGPGSLTLNGKLVTLPYTISSQDLGQKLPEIPLPMRSKPEAPLSLEAKAK